jgi:hypothetical protein
LKIIRMLSYQTLLQQLELPIDNNEDWQRSCLYKQIYGLIKILMIWLIFEFQPDYFDTLVNKINIKMWRREEFPFKIWKIDQQIQFVSTSSKSKDWSSEFDRTKLKRCCDKQHVKAKLLSIILPSINILKLFKLLKSEEGIWPNRSELNLKWTVALLSHLNTILSVNHFRELQKDIWIVEHLSYQSIFRHFDKKENKFVQTKKSIKSKSDVNFSITQIYILSCLYFVVFIFCRVYIWSCLYFMMCWCKYVYFTCNCMNTLIHVSSMYM